MLKYTKAPNYSSHTMLQQNPFDPHSNPKEQSAKTTLTPGEIATSLSDIIENPKTVRAFHRIVGPLADWRHSQSLINLVKLVGALMMAFLTGELTPISKFLTSRGIKNIKAVTAQVKSFIKTKNLIHQLIVAKPGLVETIRTQYLVPLSAAQIARLYRGLRLSQVAKKHDKALNFFSYAILGSELKNATSKSSQNPEYVSKRILRETTFIQEIVLQNRNACMNKVAALQEKYNAKQHQHIAADLKYLATRIESLEGLIAQGINPDYAFFKISQDFAKINLHSFNGVNLPRADFKQRGQMQREILSFLKESYAKTYARVQERIPQDKVNYLNLQKYMALHHSFALECFLTGEYKKLKDITTGVEIVQQEKGRNLIADAAHAIVHDEKVFDSLLTSLLSGKKKSIPELLNIDAAGNRTLYKQLENLTNHEAVSLLQLLVSYHFKGKFVLKPDGDNSSLVKESNNIIHTLVKSKKVQELVDAIGGISKGNSLLERTKAMRRIWRMLNDVHEEHGAAFSSIISAIERNGEPLPTIATGGNLGLNLLKATATSLSNKLVRGLDSALQEQLIDEVCAIKIQGHEGRAAQGHNWLKQDQLKIKEQLSLLKHSYQATTPQALKFISRLGKGDFSGLSCNRVNLSNMNINAYNLMRVSANNISCVGSALAHTSLQGARIAEQADFRDSVLDHVCFSEVQGIPSSRVEHVTMDFAQSNIRNCDFSDIAGKVKIDLRNANIDIKSLNSLATAKSKNPAMIIDISGLEIDGYERISLADFSHFGWDPANPPICQQNPEWSKVIAAREFISNITTSDKSDSKYLDETRGKLQQWLHTIDINDFKEQATKLNLSLYATAELFWKKLPSLMITDSLRKFYNIESIAANHGQTRGYTHKIWSKLGLTKGREVEQAQHDSFVKRVIASVLEGQNPTQL